MNPLETAPRRAREERLLRALEVRRPLPLRMQTDLVRLVHAGGDDLPGLVIDAYGAVARMEWSEPHWEPHIPALASALRSAWPGLSALVGLRRLPRGRAEARVLFGMPPAGHVVREDARRYFVRTATPDAAGSGIFVDQREGRRRVRAHARAWPVLNLFAHAGAFGVAAGSGGASRVDHVDAARKCAPWAALNLALNGISPRAHRFLVDDALRVLGRAARRGPGYGVIVCDPPTTALRPGGSRMIARDVLPRLAEQACRALLPGGALLLSTNDRAMSVAGVLAAAAEGAQGAGRRVRVLEEIPLGPDLPPSPDERDRPMRGAWLVLEE